MSERKNIVIVSNKEQLQEVFNALLRGDNELLLITKRQLRELFHTLANMQTITHSAQGRFEIRKDEKDMAYLQRILTLCGKMKGMIIQWGPINI